ncbi:MAG: aminotransferase class III-fold pyridoxal phosphate-dependent enzyme [Chloroflexi bacterium]|nr:aminotransferase class III-fold pyridoxal phosphate-dependent enzyme [Chloroflexota bacterium]
MGVIDKKYDQMFGKSIAWYERGKTAFAGGVTHQSRFTSPFPVYFEHAEGAFKYDVDGNEIVDYVMGNGSLLLGHSPKSVVDAVKDQIGRGTHLGGATTWEVEYAEQVKRLMPKLERIRFTAAGTESTLLAMRIARGYTGKEKIIKFKEHFHGWQDYAAIDSGQAHGGIPRAVRETVIVVPVNLKRVEQVLQTDNRVAAVIVESNGAHFGTFPLQNPTFLHDLQDLCRKYGVLFIMDEVITGFRLSKGGAQERWDLDPDITTMAKIMAGGQPGAAVGGKAEIMEVMAFKGDPEWDREKRVAQGGTYNAQPITAAAGIAQLREIENGNAIELADRAAKRLKDGFNEAFMKNEVVGHAHGLSSLVQVNLGYDCNCDRELCTMPFAEIYQSMPAEKTRALRRAALVNGADGMDWNGLCFVVASAHTDEVVDRTVAGFSQALKDLRTDGYV